VSFVYSAARVVVVPVLRAVWDVRVTGLEHLPEGPVILAANHLSAADQVFLSAISPRKVFYMAKAEYFRGRGVRGRLTASFMTTFGQIPVEREGLRAAVESLGAAEQVLKEGKIFGIFPEGTRSPDGRIYRGRTGVARLALSTGVPVVPVGIIGTDKVQPPGRPRPRIGPKIRINLGEPIRVERPEGDKPGTATVRAITDDIMAKIAALSGQEVVGSYAPRGAAAAAAAAAAANKQRDEEAG
jgi:1-acyl-sn-glycerol-3-phosphate acyltransferase